MTYFVSRKAVENYLTRGKELFERHKMLEKLDKLEEEGLLLLAS